MTQPRLPLVAETGTAWLFGGSLVLLLGALVDGVTAAVAGVANLFVDAVPHNELWKPLAMMFGLGFVVIMIIGAGLAVAQAIDHCRLRPDARVALIGRQGLYHNSTFWPHLEANPRLQDVRLENAPPTLVFDYLVRQPRGGPYVKTVRIPVPPGRESEAREVVAQLRCAIR